jgi:pimeloyl-ACP methyl ester carboxylesterase
VPVLEALAGARHVVALDLRGHGESDPATEEEYHVEDYAADVLAVADALGLRRFALSGHSVGGLVVIECAARQPERVAALLLVDPSGDSSRLPREEVEASLAEVAKEPRGEIELHFRQFLTGGAPGTSQVVLEDLARVPDEVLLPSLESAMSYPAVESLGRYSGAVACLVTPFNDSAASLPHLLPELSVHRVRNTSHWPMLDRPREIAHALAALLEPKLAAFTD